VLENTVVGSNSVPPLDPNWPAGSMAQAYRDMDTCEPVKATSRVRHIFFLLPAHASRREPLVDSRS
jgi:hypothetical protein